MPDPGEPLTVYNDKIAPPGDPVPTDGTMVDIRFGDLPEVATPTPTGTPIPTATSLLPTATSVPATATATAMATPVPASSSGCEVRTAGGFSWPLLLLALPVFLRQRRGGEA